MGMSLDAAAGLTGISSGEKAVLPGKVFVRCRTVLPAV